ncbi:LuxR family transcriptional regulator [Micromonospora sp. ATCC 39149]|uniref:AAA family ATPase n=1 Tax=Micromonospora carbonacea TaxID=47853 RepID=A0A7D5YAK5_9ACTN|nr:LuxR family transcriptional regulator [Micromonospora sp. ATCC 39149]QLJ99500.1 AAA family ATPase [Micromonospora carbonacea]
MLPRLDALPLIGRDRELVAVTRAVRGADHAGALIAGPPGVGKTRLAEEAASGAEAAGHRMLVARPAAASSRLPLSGLAGLLPAPSGAQPPDGAVRAGLVERGLHVLRGLTQGPRTVLLVDDLHELDEISAIVIHQLVAERAVTLLATVRAEAAVPSPVTALWKDRGVLRVDLGALAPAETDALIGAALGGPVEGRTLRQLREATGGNPLFLRELLISASDSGGLGRVDGVWRLTAPLSRAPRLVELLRDRLAVRDPAERDALETLALGEPLPLPVAAELAGESMLEELERRGLVTVGTTGRRRAVRLSHPLYGELLRADLPELARLRHSRRLADALDGTGARRSEDVMRTAIWRLDGGGTVHPQRMLQAADQAALIREYALAERLARHAYDSGAGVAAGLTEVRAMLCLGHIDEALERCADLAGKATNDAERVEVAVQHAAALAHHADDLAAARAVIDAAAADVPASAGQLEVSRLYLRSYGLDCSSVGAALALFEAATPDSARQEAEVVETRVAAASAAGAALMLAGRYAEAADVIGRAVPLAARHTGPGRVHADSMRPAGGWMRCVLGDPAGGFAQIQACYEASLHPPDRTAQALGAFALGMVGLMLGRPATALRWAKESFVVAEGLQRPVCRWAAAVRVQAAAQCGDEHELAAATADLDRYRGGPHSNLLFEMEVARARAWQVSVQADAVAVRTVLGDEIARHGAGGALGAATLGALDLVRLGGADLAARLLAGYPPPAGWSLGELVVRYAAAAAAADPEALLGVAQRFAGYGMTMHAAEAATLAAAAWQRAGEPRAAARARLIAELRLAAGEPAATPALATAGPLLGLTDREREVVLAAVRGEPTRAIAGRLHVAERTVENHLHRAYGKLGVSGRAELRQTLG